jgi:hypothetical protein
MADRLDNPTKLTNYLTEIPAPALLAEVTLTLLKKEDDRKGALNMNFKFLHSC